jgi:lipid-binding SYLF domain-containing protein
VWTQSAGASIGAAEAARLAAASRVVEDIRTTIPQEYWDRSRCAAVIPDLKKAAFIFGGEYGKGVISCRSGERWSAPVFLQMAKGSWGFQAGAQQIDLVLLIMNESGVQKLLQNKVTLGADASVAAGPIGRHGHIGTDAALTAEIVAYSRAKGLFAGIDISGGVLRPDEDANTAAYGPGASPRTILATREISAPPEAQPFLTALASVSTAPATSAPAPATGASTSSPARTSSQSASAQSTQTTSDAMDGDLRARIADIQQTLDRLLAPSSESPIGTGGTTGTMVGTTGGATGAGTVNVDRAALIRLRQQIDALAAAVERRRNQ